MGNCPYFFMQTRAVAYKIMLPFSLFFVGVFFCRKGEVMNDEYFCFVEREL